MVVRWTLQKEIRGILFRVLVNRICHHVLCRVQLTRARCDRRLLSNHCCVVVSVDECLVVAVVADVVPLCRCRALGCLRTCS